MLNYIENVIDTSNKPAGNKHISIIRINKSSKKKSQ